MSSPPLITLPLRRVFWLIAAFLLLALLVHGAMVSAGQVSSAPLGVGRWFPISYGHPRAPTFPQIGIAVLTVLAFAAAIRLLPRISQQYRYAFAALIGIVSMLGTTATQGIERGFVHPIAGKDPHAKPAQYWHDAERAKITTGRDALRFVQEYHAVQPTLAEHGRTHPPGAVLLFALLRQLSGNRPAMGAVLVCILSVFLVAVGFRIAGTPPYALLLFCALPAVQVYFCATLDAVIAGLLFIAIGCGLRTKNSAYRYVGAGLALLAASFLTFGVVWVVPVLFAVEAARTRWLPWRTGVILVGIALVYVAANYFVGFNYWVTFRFASGSENPDGFRGLVNPAEYLATRVENLADLSFFAGPFVLWSLGLGLSAARRESFLAWIALGAGVASLGLLFLAGAYRTGETARACLFLYPLLVVVAAHAPLAERDRNTLAVATLTLAAGMQCAGFYFW